jgi:hypothetical protein
MNIPVEEGGGSWRKHRIATRQPPRRRRAIAFEICDSSELLVAVG